MNVASEMSIIRFLSNNLRSKNKMASEEKTKMKRSARCLGIEIEELLKFVNERKSICMSFQCQCREDEMRCLEEVLQ